MELMPPAIPAGVVLTFAGNAEPIGYMFCDGRSLSRAAYPGLFAAIGTAHGAADVNSFNIPDYRGRFLRGVDGAAGLDPDKAGRTAMKAGGATGSAVGSVQADALISHSHSMTGYTSGTGGWNIQATINNLTPQSLSTNSAGGSETRPKNANVNFIIKT